MRTINFFKKKSFKINKLFPKIKLSSNFNVQNIRPLNTAASGDLSFFDSI